MALQLRNNPAPVLSGALFVSNPRRKKLVVRKNGAKKLKVVSKRANPLRKVKVKKMVRKNPLKLMHNPLRKRKVVARKNPRKARKLSLRKLNPLRRRKAVVRKMKLNPLRRRKVSRKVRKMNPKRKFSSLLRKMRKNPFKVRKARKARKAVARKNPRRSMRKVRKNPLTIGFLKPLENLVAKVPFIGSKVAPYTQPIAVAMIGGAGVVGGLSMIGRLPMVGQYAKYPFGNAFGASIMGLGLAVASAFLPVSSDTKKSLAIAFASAGGAINAGQLLMCGFDLDACKAQNLALLGSDDSADSASAVVADTAGLGDGMYYEIQPSYSGISYNGVSVDMAGVDYQSAELGDAMSCPSDLSVAEGQSAVKGREAFLQRFGMPSRKIAGAKSYQSAMVGKEGHRWGWLIKALGYQRFSKLASLPPKQRKELIAKMKASAIASSQATFDQELTGAMQGIAMSGVSMDMSGLAVDSLSGIAVAGAGI